MIDNFSENINVLNCKIFSGWYCSSIHILNGTKNVLISKNYFDGANEGMHNSAISMYHDVDNIQLRNNKFRFYENGITGRWGANNILIDSNKIDRSPVSMFNDTVFITNNIITNTQINVIHETNTSWCSLLGNRISTSVSSGIVLNVQNCLVANNYITISGINPYWGIQVSDSHNTSIIFNTVNVLNSNIGSSSILVDGGTSLDIRNNIFSNIGGGYCAYIANMSLSGIWDYNNYHNLYQRTGFLNGQTYPSFASWAGAINGESRGLSCNPFFTNDSVLVPHQILLNNAGITIPGVVSDIDGVKRDPVTPDTGASEFSPCTNDAGVNAVTFPLTPANSGNQDVKVLLQNQGTTTLASVRIDWSVNGVVQNSFLLDGIAWKR